MHQFENKKTAILFIGLLIIGLNIRFGYTQVNLDALKERVIMLETKLAEAKMRQQEAYNVQTQLEKHEQELAKLTQSEKYKIQVIEIRAKIKILRAKIEAITKEKDDLEESLRFAKIMLHDAKATASSEVNNIKKLPIKIRKNASKSVYWRFRNINIGKYFNISERNEIMKIFSNDRQYSQDNLLEGAYQVYNNAGIVIHFKISGSQNGENLEIILGQRMDPNSNSYFTYIPTQTLAQFRENYFRITIDE